MTEKGKKPLRCAIYTRKSTEHGLANHQTITPSLCYLVRLPSPRRFNGFR